jgi:amino acid transporter
MRAEIGIAMSIVSYILSMVVSIDYLRISFVFCVIAGMALYISDRKDFLRRQSGNKTWAVPLAILGLALIVQSFIYGMFTMIWMRWDPWLDQFWPLTWEESMIQASYLAIYGLVFLFGILLFFDVSKMLEDKRFYPPSGRRLDVATQPKYPRALFAKYAQQYPHNPEGVLEWHIHKKMKEGETREQAIKELRNIGDRSI